MEWKYEKSEILGKGIVRGRWELSILHNGKKIKVIQAHYNWLQGNPSFKEIPKDYIIHHLDLDPLNDDISNLALMYRFHHTAHHFKHKRGEIPVSFRNGDGNGYGIPKLEPKIRFQKGKYRKHFYIDYVKNDQDLSYEQRHKTIFSWNRVSFKSEEEARKVKEFLWPDKPWELKF